ncbi:MAG: hypothetical protein AB7I33_05915, partial [Gemmatimonadales bacterium]
LTACNRTQLVQGDCRPANGADVCTWGETAGGTLVAFGATVPMTAIENAPDDAPMTWPPLATAVIPMPEAVRSATGFQSLTMFWEPHGHPPGPYLTPHFDFHFNTADVRPIDCADTTKPAQLPAGYALPDMTDPELGTLVGLCVPKMGMHALPQAALSDTAIFKAAMLVGYYHGQPVFLEPMIARATLLERRSFPLTWPAVPDHPAAVRMPATFRAEYDSTAQAYRFVFSGLTPAGS